GLGRLVDRLAGSLPAGVLRTGTTAAAVTRSGPGPEPWVVRTGSGDTLRAAAVVLALPAAASARLLRELDPGLADQLAAIPYGSVATVNLAYARSAITHPLDGLGFVVPRSEGGTLVACTFSSVKFEGRAPADGVLLRAFAAAGDGSDAAALERETHAALARLLGITAAPRIAQVRVWRGAMPRYAVGHGARLAATETRLADHPGLLLAGNGLRGVGLPDCVRGGERAAETVAAAVGWYPVRPAAAQGEAR
ncbi:MAG: protoporphyrinogen oxidase, partial [Candidatus Polarisedimenticolia bacterium]